MNTNKKIPVLTEVIGEDGALLSSGTFVTDLENAKPIFDIFRESASAVGPGLTHTSVLHQGEIFYGSDKIEDVRFIGYDSALVSADESNIEDAVIKTQIKPCFEIFSSGENCKILPDEADRPHLAFYALPQSGTEQPSPLVALSWKVAPKFKNFDSDIYEPQRISLFFQNSCSLIAAASVLLASEEGVQFLEETLGQHKGAQLKEWLRPIKPNFQLPISKITIEQGEENLCYTFQLEILAYYIAKQYYATIDFSKKTIVNFAEENGWSIERAKAIACVKHAAATNNNACEAP